MARRFLSRTFFEDRVNPKEVIRDSRQRLGLRRASGAFERLVACEKLQRFGALQDATASQFMPFPSEDDGGDGDGE
jgi:hypothetical protein